MKLLLAKSEDKERWDSFANKNNGTIFHSFTWKRIVEKSLKYKPYFFYVEDNSKIKAICPFFLSKGSFFGKKFFSQGDSVGPLGDKKAVEFMLKEIISFAKKLNIDQIVIHDMKKELMPKNLDLEEPWPYVSFLINLKQSEEDLIKSFQKWLRKGIRREFARNKIEFINIDSLKQLKIFYKFYQDNMHFLGTPPLIFKFFKEMFESLYPDKFFGFILSYNGKNAGAVINLIDGKKTRCFLSMVDSKYRKTNANAVLLLESMKQAMKKTEIFDFGGSRPGSGNHVFKLKWNPQEIERPIVYKLLKKEAVITDPRNKKLQKYSNLWKKIPKPICNLIGPYVRIFMGR